MQLRAHRKEFTRLRPALAGLRRACLPVRQGFTFVELLLFAGIISIMAGALVGFALVSNNISVHNEVVSEVEQNGDLVMQRILRTAKEGGRIAYPLSDQAGNELLITSGNPEKEILFYLHGDRIAMVENGVASFLSTGEVTMDSLSFLHYGEPESVEGLSIVFRAANTAIANEVRAGQYTKIFRGTATLPPGGCVADADCPIAPSPFNTCCEGLCRPSCGSCTSHSDCGTNQVCCVESGVAVCKAAAACATPQCDDVADCPATAPSCDLANCNYRVPTCASNVCGLLTVGPCPQCSYCGDGRHDPFKGEECDDGNSNNTDGCLSRCRFARCGDGARQPLGKNGVAGGGDDEECDDGNANDDDGCDSACLDENLCSGGSPNGTQTGDEQCDDGNAIQTDTCDNFCRRTRCGDGTIQSPNGRGQSEECDDGNALAGDLCSPTCLTVTADECGNGVKETGEDCDDGKRCTIAGQPCQFDADCPGAGNLCRGANIDGCTTPSGCTPTQTPESTCNDAIDNDCDNLIDCADTSNCPNGTSCAANGRQCAAGTCACPGGEATETTCNDSADNDCDGAVDCADSNCNGLTCAPGKTCQGGACSSGSQCGDTVDNDGDTNIDCADAGCISAEDWVDYKVEPADDYGTLALELINMDGDADLDIVYSRGCQGTDCDYSGDLHWYESNGALPPSFTRRNINISDMPNNRIDVDLINDDDSYIDVVGGGGSLLAWFKNNGSQVFTKYDITTSITGTIDSVYIVDWNSNGQKDILVFHSDGVSLGGATVYENNGSESFTEKHLVTDTVTNAGQPGDFDGDGRLDVLIGDPNSLDWYRNTDNSTVPFPLGSTIASGYVVKALHAANLDGDSDLDVIASDPTATHWYQNAAGSFTPKTDINSLASFTATLRAGDVDEDSDIDIIARNDNNFRVYFNSGGGNPTFSAGQTVTAAGWPVEIEVGNLKNDSDAVLAVPSAGGISGVHWYDDVGAGQCYPLDDGEAS